LRFTAAADINTIHVLTIGGKRYRGHSQSEGYGGWNGSFA
jgi:hypothetical protein